jgi:hypothetical protein
MDVDKQKISIALKSTPNNLRYDKNYYLHDGKYFKIPKRQTAEYGEYQLLMVCHLALNVFSTLETKARTILYPLF